MEDFTCEYSKHHCELKLEQKKTSGFKARLKNLFIMSEKNFQSHWYVRSKGAIQLEILKQKTSEHWYIVHPFSQLRLCWEIFMLGILFFSVGFLPFRCGFLNPFMAKYYEYKGRSTKNIEIALTIDFYLNWVWATDMIGNFVTGYYEKSTGKIIMEPYKIQKKYLVPGFIIDLTTSVPVDYIIYRIGGIHTYANMDSISFVFLELYNIYSVIRFRNYIKYCYRFKRLGSFSLLLFRLLSAVLIYFWIINWSICFGLVVPQMLCGDNLYKNSTTKIVSWIQASDILDMTLLEQYSTALLKALHNNVGVSTTWETMFSVEDYVLAVVVSNCGRVYWVYFLISLLEVITAAHALRVKFNLIVEQLKAYMKQKEFPVYLKKRLNRFYLYRFQAHYFHDRSILGRLTESLRKEIGMYTCQRLIHNTEVFQSIPKKVVARLVQRMNREMYFPNDVIIQGNTFGESMYFICSGTVAVWTVSGKQICLLEDGDFFGEIALIVQDRRRTATVTAMTITEVYRLESSDYKRIIELYPDVYNRLERYALERYKTILFMEGKSENNK